MIASSLLRRGIGQRLIMALGLVAIIWLLLFAVLQ